MRVLIADDDASTRYLLDLFCRGRDFETVFVESGRAAIERFGQGDVHVVVTDVRMPDIDGETVLKSVKQVSADTPVLIMTAHGSIDDAVRFLKQGADDYIPKPITQEVLLHRLDQALARVAMAREIAALRAGNEPEGGTRIVGNSAPMLALLRRLPMTAKTDASVVIFGESGTGKELVAARLHELSKRRGQPFVTVNCGALTDTLLESELFGYKRGAFTDAFRDTPGLVEEARGGTLFLDEIGEVSPAVQVKLLRFLQSKEYKELGSPKIKKADVRIIAATNRDLRRMVDEGSFREDLYYRLNIIPLTVPPLRTRKSDIPILAMHFLNAFRQEFQQDVRGFTPEVMAHMVAYDWPGNVRELENRVQQLVVLATGPMVSAFDAIDDLATESAPALGTFRDEKKRLIAEFEREYVRQKLQETDGNLSEAARRAGLDRKNFWTIAKRHGLWPAKPAHRRAS